MLFKGAFCVRYLVLCILNFLQQITAESQKNASVVLILQTELRKIQKKSNQQRLGVT